MSNRPNTRSRSATAEKSKKIDEPSKKKALHTRQGAVPPSSGGSSGTGGGGGGGSSAKWIWIGLAAAVIVVLVVAVVIVQSRGGNDSSALVYGNVTVSGTPLPEQTQGQADPAVGQTIPTLVGQNFEGQKTEIAPNGKPKVVMFLAHWCPHCQAEVPRIVQELKDKGTPTDVEIYAVPTGTDQSRTNFPPAKWIKRENLNVPVLVDTADGKAAKAYGIGGFPYFVVVGADGKVIQRTSGELGAGQFTQLVNAARSAAAATTGTAGASSPVPGNG